MDSQMQLSTPLCKAAMTEQELSAEVPQDIPDAHVKQPEKIINGSGDKQNVSFHVFFQDALLHEYLVFWA